VSALHREVLSVICVRQLFQSWQAVARGDPPLVERTLHRQAAWIWTCAFASGVASPAEVGSATTDQLLRPGSARDPEKALLSLDGEAYRLLTENTLERSWTPSS
jgi:hypothetical protein